MTHDQQVALSMWHRFGAAFFIAKRGRGRWVIHGEGITAPLGRVPAIFTTKREAMAYVDNLICISARRWREGGAA